MSELNCKSCANYKEEGCIECGGFVHKKEEPSPLEALKALVYGEEHIKGTDVEKRLYKIVETALKENLELKESVERLTEKLKQTQKQLDLLLDEVRDYE